jgi:hypothetical protein
VSVSLRSRTQAKESDAPPSSRATHKFASRLSCAENSLYFFSLYVLYALYSSSVRLIVCKTNTVMTDMDKNIFKHVS